MFFGIQVQKAYRSNSLYKKWFIKGLTVKLLGGLAFAFVYTFYYEYGGDSRSYFEDSMLVAQSITDGLQTFFDVLNRKIVNVEYSSLSYVVQMAFKDPREYFVVNFVSIFTVLGGFSYFSTSLLIATFTYWGVWRFYELMVKFFPDMEREMAFAILFVPSVVFWGSGISKDSLILCCVGLFLYHINEVMSGKFWQIRSLLIIVVTGYFMFVVKAYVLISLAPAIILWRTLYLKDRIKSGLIRGAILPVFLGVGIFGMVYTLNWISIYSSRYSIDSFVSTAQSMQDWHYVEGANSADNHGRGSSYTLGEYDGSDWRGLLKIFPAAVNVTYFRPYLWEVNNAAMLAQAMESLIFLLVTVFTLIRVGPLKVYRFISNDSLLLMCVVFAIFFGFAVGFSSYNFGALSRYKIPAVPFFVAALLIIRHKHLMGKRGKYFRKHQLAA